LSAVLGGLVSPDSEALVRYRGVWSSTSLTLGAESLPAELRRMVLDGVAAQQRFETAGGTVHLAVGVPLPGGRGDYFEVFSLEDLHHTYGVLQAMLLATVGAAPLLGMLLGWWVARPALRPLRTLSQAAAAMAGGDLGVRIDPNGDRDLVPLAAAFNQTADALERDARRHELLVRASAALNRELDLDVELRELARVVVPELVDLSTVHLLAHPVPAGELPALPVIADRVAVAAAPGRPHPAVARGLRWEGFGDPVTEAIRRGELMLLAAQAQRPPRWAQTAGVADAFHAGLAHIAAAPVIVDGLVVAVATFGLWNDRPSWNDADLAVLGQIARYAGVAVDHALTYQRTRDSALVLQRSLLTDPPTIAGLEMCARYQPAGRDEVGGDWYDAFPLDDDTLAITVGDVVGHDITAAAAMGQLRATLRGLALDGGDGPADALDRLAAINTQLAITAFATVIHAHLTRRGNGVWTMCWATAGHPPPLLVTPGAGARQLEQLPARMALIRGVSAPRRAAEITLPPGSTVLLYTDGLVERPGIDLIDGLATLTARARAAAALPIGELCDALLLDAPTGDDIALLAVRTRP